MDKQDSDNPPPRMPSFSNPHFPVCCVHKGSIQSQGTPTQGRENHSSSHTGGSCHKALKHPKKCFFHEPPFQAKKSTHCSQGNNWGPTPTAESTVLGRIVLSLQTSWAEE